MLRSASAPADQLVEIDFEAAAEWLLGNATGDEALNQQSVWLYDFAHMSEASAVHRASPRIMLVGDERASILSMTMDTLSLARQK